LSNENVFRDPFELDCYECVSSLFGLLNGGPSPLHAQFSLDREPMGLPVANRPGDHRDFLQPKVAVGLPTNQTVEFIELYNSKPWPEDIAGYTIRSIADAASDGTSVYTLLRTQFSHPTLFSSCARARLG
jgi:hypothetical protein